LEERTLLAATLVGGATYATIQEAVNSAASGAVIEIDAGTYAESVNLSKMQGGSGDLTLRGVGGDVVIQPLGGRAVYNGNQFTGNVTLENLVLTTPTNDPLKNDTGLALSNYHGNLLVKDTRFLNNFENGIEIGNTTGSVTILGGSIVGMGQKAIFLKTNVQNVTIDGVSIDGLGLSTDSAIRAKDVSGLTVINSTIRGSGDAPADEGIDMRNVSGTVLIAGNTISAVADDGVQLENNVGAVDLTIRDNVILGNATYTATRGAIDVKTYDFAVVTLTITGNVTRGFSDHSITVDNGGSAQVTARIAGNSVDGALNHGIDVKAKSTAAQSVTIVDNVLANIGDRDTDAAIRVESSAPAGASVTIYVHNNSARTVSGSGLSVTVVGGAGHTVTATNNFFQSTNLSGGIAAVRIDDTGSTAATVITAALRNNVVTPNPKGSFAYQLNHAGAGAFRLKGNLPTSGKLPSAKQIVEQLNYGRNVNVAGAVSLVNVAAYAPTAAISGPTSALVPGQTLTFVGTTNADLSAGNYLGWIAVNSSGQAIAAGSGATFQFAPPTTGTFTIRLNVTTDDGAGVTVTQQVSVNNMIAVSNGVLYVGGTAGRDLFEIANGTGGKLKVTITELDNRKRKTTAEHGPGITKVVVYGQAGNDVIRLLAGVTVPAELFGGGGNDSLEGGAANDLLDGGEGNDTLKGNGGADVFLNGEVLV
jgi:hypothetical protein